MIGIPGTFENPGMIGFNILSGISGMIAIHVRIRIRCRAGIP